MLVPLSGSEKRWAAFYAIFPFMLVQMVLLFPGQEGYAPARTVAPQTDVGFFTDVVGIPPHPTWQELHDFDHISYVTTHDFENGITHGYANDDVNNSPLAAATWQELHANADRLANCFGPNAASGGPDPGGSDPGGSDPGDHGATTDDENDDNALQMQGDPTKPGASTDISTGPAALQGHAPPDPCLPLGDGFEYRGGSCVPATQQDQPPSDPCLPLGDGFEYRTSVCP